MTEQTLPFGNMTSAEAFRTAMADGTISKRQQEVLDWIRAHGPTQARRIEVPGGWKRISELRKLGLIECYGLVVDDITKKRAVAWMVKDDA